MTGISARLTTALCALLLQQAALAADIVTRPAEQALLAAYRKMEEGDRNGNGELWLTLRDRATLASMNDALKETIRKGGHSRPAVEYQPLAARAAGVHGVILGKVSDPQANTVQYEAVSFTLEDGEWKVAGEQWSERPLDEFAMYAILAPSEGSFAHDGAPWKTIAYAASNPEVVRKEDVVWKVQATFDESFLYVRFESKEALPAAGSKLRPNVGKTGDAGGPPAPPALRIKSSGTDRYAISVTSLVSAATAVDAKGKPVGEKYTVGYTLSVKKSEREEVYAATIGENAHSPLLTVRDRFIDIRIPVDSLGGQSNAKPTLDLEEEDPVNRVLPYHVQTYLKQ